MSNPADLNIIPQPDTDKNFFNFKAVGLKIDKTYAIKFQWIYDDLTLSDWSPGFFVNTSTESVPAAPTATVTGGAGIITVSLATFPTNALRVDVKIAGGTFGNGTVVVTSFTSAGTKTIVAAGSAGQGLAYVVTLLTVTPSKINGDPSSPVTVYVTDVGETIQAPTNPNGFSIDRILGGIQVNWAGTYANGTFTGFEAIKIYVGNSATATNGSYKDAGVMTGNNVANSITIPVDGVYLRYDLPVYIHAAAINKSGTVGTLQVNVANNNLGARSAIGSDLANDIITNAKLVADSVTSTKIIINAITEEKIAANAVTATKVALGAITEAKIDNNAITAAKIAAGAVTETKIANDSISSPKIVAGSITAGKIDAGAVTADKISANAVTADKILTNAITSDKILANAITSDKINALAITSDKINALAITSDKINALAITAGKIDALAITADKIAANAITATKIKAGEIDVTKLSAGTISVNNLDAGTIKSTSFIRAGSKNVGAGTGARVEMSSSNIEDGVIDIAAGFYIYNSAGTAILSAPLTGGLSITGGGSFTGDISGANGTFAGNLSSSGGLFTVNNGVLTAQSGTIGGWTINGSVLESSLVSNNKITLNPATPKIALVQSSVEKITIDPVEGIVGPNITYNGTSVPSFKLTPNGNLALYGSITVTGGNAATSDQVNLKNKTFVQNDAPTNPISGYSLVTGDLWFDANDNNKQYRWSGSAWQIVQDGTIAAAKAKADTSLQQGGNEIRNASNQITTIDSTGIKINGTSFSLNGNGTATTASANSMVINASGITAQNGSGQTTFSINASTGNAEFKGSITSGSSITGSTVTSSAFGIFGTVRLNSSNSSFEVLGADNTVYGQIYSFNNGNELIIRHGNTREAGGYPTDSAMLSLNPSTISLGYTSAQTGLSTRGIKISSTGSHDLLGTLSGIGNGTIAIAQFRNISAGTEVKSTSDSSGYIGDIYIQF